MTAKIVKVEKNVYCERLQENVVIEVETVYAAENLPDQAPRILSRRCAHAIECNLVEHPVCVFCGTNPNFDPTE
ncbi:MAG: hypothetical protein LC099_08115 [Anaerolineales bacterium]|nr:hypothetical protein [Anaerolineales bacterium]